MVARVGETRPPHKRLCSQERSHIFSEKRQVKHNSLPDEVTLKPTEKAQAHSKAARDASAGMTGCGSLKVCSRGQTRQLSDSQADLSPNMQCCPSAACELDDVKLGHRGAWTGSRDRDCGDRCPQASGLG